MKTFALALLFSYYLQLGALAEYIINEAAWKTSNCEFYL